MFTQDQAKYLLGLPKAINGTGAINLLDSKIRLNLFSPDDDEWKFLMEITSNKKISFRLSFHHQEDTVKEGLLRLDYKSGHQNPETLNPLVPVFLQPYAGYRFVNESHIHVFVEGYKDLAWAMPVKDYGKFPIEIISNTEYSGAVAEFAKEINLTSKLEIQSVL